MNFNFIKKNILMVFFFLSFLILGLLILTNYLSTQNIEPQILTQYSEHRDLLLEKSANDIEKDIFNKKLELKILEKKLILDEIIINSCSNLSFLPNDNSITNLENYFIINKDGKIISCSDSNYFDYLNLNIKNTNYFKDILNSKETIIEHIKTSSPGQLYLLTPVSYKNNKFDVVSIFTIVEINNLYSKYIHELMGKENYYYLFDKTNSKIIMKSVDLNKSIINEYVNNSIKNINIVNLNSNEFVFNKKQLKIGNEIWEIGLLSSTKEVKNIFTSLNKKHLISFVFILIILTILFIIIKLNNKSISKSKKISLDDSKINFDNESSNLKSLSNNKLNNGGMYFIRDDFEQSYELFINTLIDKKIGLGFLQSNIDKFKTKYNLDKTSFIKLSDEINKNSKYVLMIDSKIIFKLICDFLNKNNKPKIIFIDHLDFIILKNSFKDVLVELYELKEKIKNSNNIFLFSLNQNVISNRELLVLEKEFVDIETQEKKLMENISDLELQILIYINNSNNNKVEIRYKDISSKFNITKPTTSKKINQLEKMNLILIKDMGRRKIIEITQKGRKII